MDLHLHHDFTLNPDGSGRVRLQWSGPERGAADAAEFVRSELQQASGVAAWQDVDCRTEDGRLCFAATAWFADVTALRFHCQGFHCNVLDFEVTQDADGEVTVASRRAPTTTPATPLPTTPAALQQERAKLQTARGFLGELFAGLRCTAILRLPGVLAEPVPGERLDERSLRVEFSGDDMLAAIDRLLADEVLLRRLLAAGDVGPEAAMALLAGQGPVRVRTRGGVAPQFDFATEVAAAAAAWTQPGPDGADRPALRQQGPPLQQVRVLGCKLVHEADDQRGIQPLGQGQPGCTFCIAGELPEPVLGLEEAVCAAATAVDGTDLLPADEWDRRIHFPKLTDDGRTVWFDVALTGAPGRHGGLQELRGHVQVLLARGEREVDLGFPRLRPDQDGKVFGAKLLQCGTDGDTWTCEVQLQLARVRIRSMHLRAGEHVVALRQRGYSSCNDECTLQYEAEAPPPKGARVYAVVVDEVLAMDLPFVLPPVDGIGMELIH